MDDLGTTEVAVIGSGAAGLMAARAAHRLGVDTMLLTDRALGRSNTVMAQGGLQLPFDSEASVESLVADMVRAGGPPASMDLITAFAAEIRPTIAGLEQDGLAFDRNADGTLRRRIAGGMSEARVVGIGDDIGRPLTRLLVELTRTCEIGILENTSVHALTPEHGEWIVHTSSGSLRTRSVICATGGSTWALAVSNDDPTSNPKNNNHTLAATLRDQLGLAEIDGNLVQYQPFGDVVTVSDGTPGKLIPERIVSFPVKLLDRHGDEVVDPRAGRRIVTEAAKRAFAEGRGVPTEGGRIGLRLTLSEVPNGELAGEFPKLHRRLQRDGRLGEDIVVAPFMHYQLGGFVIDSMCRTSMPGLFMAGEMVGGIHGHDRLMGNGLTDSLVHGRRAGTAAARWLRDQP